MKILRKLCVLLTYKRISITLTLFSLILWSYSIIRAKFVIGKFGIISGFGITFFVSLGILIIAASILWRVKENHWKLLLTQLCILVISLFMAPLIVGAAQPLYEIAIHDIGWTEHIFRSGSITSESFWSLWQLSWPGNYLVQTISLLFTGTDTNNFRVLLPWIPIIWQFLFFFPLFILFRNTIGTNHPNYCWAALWIFYLGNWVGVQNNGAQPFGVFFVFSILAIFLRFSSLHQRIISFRYRLVGVIILASVTIGHFLGSLITCSVCLGLYISKNIKMPYLVITAAIFITSWSLYGASTYFDFKLLDFFQQSLRLDIAFQRGIIDSVSSSESHSSVSFIRIVFSLFLLALGFLGVLVSLKSKHKKHIDITYVIIAVTFILVAICVGSSYRYELFNRFFLFLLPFIGYFVIKLVNYRATFFILTILLVFSLPFCFISQHGNQKMDYLSQGYLNGVYFFHNNSSHGFIFGEAPIPGISNMENYIRKTYDELINDKNEIILVGKLWRSDHTDYLPQYICISDHDKSVYDYFKNLPSYIDDTQNIINKTSDCNNIFMNSNMNLYIFEVYH